jgi:hypothetical protein
MFEDLDWRYGADHMWEKHGVTVREANEAVRDPDRVLVNPDYNSQSGRTVRIIGYCQQRGELLSIIAINDHGTDYGVNGWASNSKDRRIYREAEEA